MLQSLCERAVEWRQLDSNPVRTVRKPPQVRGRAVRPLPPRAVEAMRAFLTGTNRLQDATLVSVLAYAGLRPGEAIGLKWQDIGERTILVERAVAFGQLKSTKTAGVRSVRLLAPLEHDLAQWRGQTEHHTDEDLVFPSPDGTRWNADRARNWRKRAFQEAADHADVPAARPYDLRHSFVSLLIAQRATAVEVARQAGHAPTMTLSTYAHLFDELDGVDNQPAERQIQQAREAQMCPDVSVLCPRPGARSTPSAEKVVIYRTFPEPSIGLEPMIPSLRSKCSHGQKWRLAGYLIGATLAEMSSISGR